jgi:carbonic anhydrase/acetyltransferase-like protein (isoleucine patch superfamily)
MNLEANTAGDLPQVDESAYVHRSAVVIGNIRIGAKVYVGPCAVIRADEPGPDGNIMPITIGAEANVQDGAILHALGGTGVSIGPGTSIAHGAVVHGPCSIGRGGFVGFNSVVFNTTLGKRVVVMHGAVVEGVSVPDGLYVPSMAVVCCHNDVRRLRPASPEVLAFAARVRLTNIGFAKAGHCRPAALQAPSRLPVATPGPSSRRSTQNSRHLEE